MIGAALRIFLFFTVLTGVLYPLAMTGFAQVAFRDSANGSMIIRDGKAVGSRLIAQKFSESNHFWSRPSAVDYNPLPSGGSNFGPTSADLKAKIEERRKAGMTGDLLFASASGLDPEISVEGANAQVGRVAHALALSTQQVEKLVSQNTEPSQFGLFGAPRVNVLELNLALEDLRRKNGQ